MHICMLDKLPMIFKLYAIMHNFSHTDQQDAECFLFTYNIKIQMIQSHDYPV